MKKVLVAIIATVAVFGNSAVAVAEGKGLHKSKVAAVKAENDAKRNAYKEAMRAHIEAKKARGAAMKAIGERFKADADALRTKIKADVAAATSVEAKKAAAAAGKAAMNDLIAERKASIAALPAVGAKPVKPTMAPRPVKPAPKVQSQG